MRPGPEAPGRIDVAAGEDLAVRLREASGPVVTAVVALPADAPALALIRAVVAVVALERAPGVRINAVAVGVGGAQASVAAAVAYLAGAGAVTGVVLEIG